VSWVDRLDGTRGERDDLTLLTEAGAQIVTGGETSFKQALMVSLNVHASDSQRIEIVVDGSQVSRRCIGMADAERQPRRKRNYGNDFPHLHVSMFHVPFGPWQRARANSQGDV
jgi:hypothetical protein